MMASTSKLEWKSNPPSEVFQWAFAVCNLVEMWNILPFSLLLQPLLNTKNVLEPFGVNPSYKAMLEVN